MSFLACLVSLKVFGMDEVGFLPVGHTHTDFDQTFSTTSRKLYTHDSITRTDLPSVFSNCYN